MPSSARIRLDDLLVLRGHFADRAAATRAIIAGEVTSEKRPALKPGTSVRTDEQLSIRESRRYVSRGGDKLACACEAWKLPCAGARCIDIGASSGGFTDCLLQHQAASVLAVDVGYGQFDWRLREDPRVQLMERTNIRKLALAMVGEAFDLAVVDLSFTRTSSLLAHICEFLKATGQMVVLVKPQFELASELIAGTASHPFDGVVRDRRLHIRVLEDFLAAAKAAGFVPHGLIPSPLTGPEGNVEFLFWASRGGSPATIDILEVVGLASE
ncbi:MAG: TlyA family RNA methyltransferase [Actinomycetia bacterium]|nr:TlyA family RNA methyltransferase [Actinomycetes bacterium]